MNNQDSFGHGVSGNIREFRTISSKVNWDVDIKLKTRLETYPTVPLRLYSPIWYQFHHFITGSCEKKFIVVRSRVSVDGECTCAIKTLGDSDVVLNRKSGFPYLNGFSKIKIQDSSFHHERKAFILEFFYYDSSDLSKPVLVKQSPKFHVFSRKPKSTRIKKKDEVKRESPSDDGKSSGEESGGENNDVLGKRKRNHILGVDEDGVRPKTSHFPPDFDLCSLLGTFPTNIVKESCFSTIVRKGQGDRRGSEPPVLDFRQQNGLSSGGHLSNSPLSLSSQKKEVAPNQTNANNEKNVQPPLKKRKLFGLKYRDSKVVSKEGSKRLNELVSFTDEIPNPNMKRNYLINSILVILNKMQSM